MKPETLLSAFAVFLAGVAMAYTVYVAREDRNAALISIGVAVLRADPSKEAQVSAARGWALDLIDANAGGVKFSPEARAELLHQPLRFTELSDTGYVVDAITPHTPASGAPQKPPANQAPK
jgi:hypothetical protein